MASGIIGTGSWAPPDVVTNYQIHQWTGAQVELIRDRTGIEERRYAPDSMATSDLAFEAVSEMRKRGEISRERVRAVIVATSTPDHPQTGYRIDSVGQAWFARDPCIRYHSGLQRICLRTIGWRCGFEFPSRDGLCVGDRRRHLLKGYESDRLPHCKHFRRRRRRCGN